MSAAEVEVGEEGFGGGAGAVDPLLVLLRGGLLHLRRCCSWREGERKERLCVWRWGWKGETVRESREEQEGDKKNDEVEKGGGRRQILTAASIDEKNDRASAASPCFLLFF